MRKILFTVFLLLFVIAADWLGEVPEWVVVLVTVLLIPVLVEILKAIALKTNQVWLTGKAALSVMAFLIAVVLSALFVQWGQLPALPEDPAQAASALVGYATAFFGASTGLYNVVLGALLDRAASSKNLLSYRL